jgi:hypothetical protein
MKKALTLEEKLDLIEESKTITHQIYRTTAERPSPSKEEVRKFFGDDFDSPKIITKWGHISSADPQPASIGVSESYDPEQYWLAYLNATEKKDPKQLLDLLYKKTPLHPSLLPLLADLLNPDVQKDSGKPKKINTSESWDIYIELIQMVFKSKISYSKASEELAQVYGVEPEAIREHWENIALKIAEDISPQLVPQIKRQYKNKKS